MTVLPRLILVCGSRDWRYADTIRQALAEYLPPVGIDEPTIIHGGCRGADRIAGEVALDLGFWVEPPMLADWAAHGNAAGPIRNRLMLDRKPDLVLAFGDGKGTRDTVAEAQRRGIPTRRILREGAVA